MLVTATNASYSPTLTDMTPVHLTGFKAHVIAGTWSPASIPSSATQAEDRCTHCTSPGRWDGNCVKALGFAIGDRKEGEKGGLPCPAGPPNTASPCPKLLSCLFLSLKLISTLSSCPATRTSTAALGGAGSAEPARPAPAHTAQHSTDQPHTPVCKPPQDLPQACPHCSISGIGITLFPQF